MKKDTAIIQILTEPNGGGAELIGRELGKNLRNLGYKSFVIYFSNPKNIFLDNWEIVLGNFNPRDLRNSILLNKEIKKFKKKYSYLILHSHLTWPFLYVSLIKNSTQIKKIYTEHNTHNKRRNFIILRIFERFLYSRYDFIVCISKGTKSSLEKWLKKDFPSHKSSIIYNGSRSFKYSNRCKKNPKKLNIVSIGSLTYQKGFDIAIKAINICKYDINQYSIYGEGPERNKLESLIKKFKLDNTIKLKGFKNNLPECDLDADLGLITSRWEGFGLAATELLSAGIPLIASNTNGLNEILKECKVAILVNKLNEYSFSLQIKKAKKTLLLNKSVDKVAIKYSKNFSFERMIKEYQKIYELFT